LWRKGVYEEWFEYGKLHQQRGGKLSADFGKLCDFKNFEAWWRHPDYGFELFCEPFIDDLAKVVTDPSKPVEANHILLEIDLNADSDRIISDFKRVLRNQKVSEEYSSKARFQPSKEMKFIKVRKLRSFRQTFELTEEMKHTEVVEYLNLVPENLKHFQNDDPQFYERLLDSALRKVGRHKKSVLNIFKNLEKGSFP